MADKKQKRKQNRDSFTEVNYSLDEPRETVGFKCNKKLWNAFVPFSRREYGSVCHVLEPIILALLTSKVNQSKTIKPLHIENLNVARVVKRVRRYSEEVIEVHYCNVAECNYRGRIHLVDPSGRHWFFCKKHSVLPLRQGFVRVSRG